MNWCQDHKVDIFSLNMQATNVNTQPKAPVAKVVKAAGKKKVAFKSLFIHVELNSLSHIFQKDIGLSNLFCHIG